jgi:hypothetical protein
MKTCTRELEGLFNSGETPLHPFLKKGGLRRVSHERKVLKEGFEPVLVFSPKFIILSDRRRPEGGTYHGHDWTTHDTRSEFCF